MAKSFFGPEGIKWMKDESKRIMKKPFKRTLIKPIVPYRTKIFEHFDSDDSIKGWKTWEDSKSENGFSTSTFTRSPNGHAVFKGILDNRVPADGVTTQSGFVCIIGPTAPRTKTVQIETFWDWTRYNLIELKFRGDGRKYNLVLNVGTYTNDIRYYDMFSYPLYTRGGPFWQVVRIPFSKFIFSVKGRVQDIQCPLPLDHIKFVAISLSDTVDGPFALEIDYIGLCFEPTPIEERTAYEHYAVPHIRWKPIEVDHGPA